MYEDLKGKTAFITGAALISGIGAGIAREFAACGMDIILADLPHPAEPGSRPIDECCRAIAQEYGVRTLAIDLDVTSQSDIDRAVEAVKAFTPELHVLVNNAGMNMGANFVGDYDPEAWIKVIDVNLFGPFRLIRSMLHLIPRGGSVINIASRAGKRPLPRCSAYSASKAALIMLTKNIAVEYGPKGIRANALCPGQILTELNLRRYAREAATDNITPEEALNRAVATVPLGRIGTPQDVGRAAAFLASEASSYMTGQAFNVTGGQITEL